MAQLTARSSTIFIATGEETRVYRSVDDVPPALRRKLTECTHGINSATILIADKRGREELVRALQGRPSEVQCRLVENIRSRQTEAASTVTVEHRPLFSSFRIWMEVLLSVAVGASIWLFLGSHF